MDYAPFYEGACLSSVKHKTRFIVNNNINFHSNSGWKAQELIRYQRQREPTKLIHGVWKDISRRPMYHLNACHTKLIFFQVWWTFPWWFCYNFIVFFMAFLVLDSHWTHLMFSSYEWKDQHEHSTKYLFIFNGNNFWFCVWLGLNGRWIKKYLIRIAEWPIPLKTSA